MKTLAKDSLPKEQQAEIFKNFGQFEKRFGSRASVEDVVWSKRRAKYEDKLAKVTNLTVLYIHIKEL